MSEPLTVPSSLTAQVERLLPSARLGRLGRLRRGWSSGLRADANGHIAQTVIRRRWVKTDSSAHHYRLPEALLSITPVYLSLKRRWRDLICVFTYHHLENSGPGQHVRFQVTIVRLADYGSSNVGTMKHVNVRV